MVAAQPQVQRNDRQDRAVRPEVRKLFRGVLLFLIGAALFALPLLVPEKAAVPRSDDTTDTGVPLVGPGVSPRTALILPADPEVTESEPNDRDQSANQIALGQTVPGDVLKGNNDRFAVDMQEDLTLVDLRVRNLGEAARPVRLMAEV